MPPNWTETQPFGLHELEPDAATRYTPRSHDPLVRTDAVRCCVRGCSRWLARRARGKANPATVCPDHGISVSHSSPTYVYDFYRRNFIVDFPHFERVKKFKYESWRLPNESSEDALTWNVFVALAGMGSLASIFHLFTGRETVAEPELYLWGVRVAAGEPRLWDDLRNVRGIVEPRAGTPTEPDIILRVPGVAVVLVEAKFGSPNPTLKGRVHRYVSVAHFLNVYRKPGNGPDPLNREWIVAQPADAVLQQLVRNVVFAQWLARHGEQPWVVNLVRVDDELGVEQRMAEHLGAEQPVRFRRLGWEELFALPVFDEDRAAPLRRYLVEKTLGLKKAFPRLT